MIGTERLRAIVLELVSRPGHEKVRALVYDLMVESKVVLVAKSHDTKHRSDRALARCQNRADQKNLCFPPGSAMENYREWIE